MTKKVISININYSLIQAIEILSLQALDICLFMMIKNSNFMV